MNKNVRTRLLAVCPYVTEEEAEAFWNQAKVIAGRKRLRGPAYWNVVAKIAEKKADKLNQKRLDADEKQWREEFKKRQSEW